MSTGEGAGGLIRGGRAPGESKRARAMSGRVTPIFLPSAFLPRGFDSERAPARDRGGRFASGETDSELSLNMSTFSSVAVA